MVEYDESFFRARAEYLYQKAKGIQLRTAIRAGLKGIVFGVVIVLAIAVSLNLFHLENVVAPDTAENEAIGLTVILGLVGAIYGWERGRAEADLLRYQAQEILWKVRVENNIRKLSAQPESGLDAGLEEKV